MADWTKLSQIDDLDKRQDGNGTSYTGRYYALVADRASFPQRGDDATSMSTSEIDLTGWCVNSVAETAYSATSCIVVVTATRYLRSGSAWSSTLLSEYSVAFEASEIQITQEMLGLMQHDGSAAEVIQDGTGNNTKYMAAAFSAPSTRFTKAQWESATYRPVACPFTVRPAIQYLGQKLPTMVAAITFHTTRRAAVALDHSLWSGVLCRASAATQWQMPSKYGLPNSGATGTTTTGGYWRVAPDRGQEATPVRDPATNRMYYRITRRLERVPLANDMASPAAQLLWRAQSNGGYLQW